MFLLTELIIWAFVCLLFVAYERGTGAFIATVIAAGIAAFSGFNVFMLAWNNPSTAATAIAGWFGIGMIWCSVRWYTKLRKASKLYLSDMASYVASNDGSIEQDFIDQVKGNWCREKYAPTLGANKGNLGFWMMWWPFSMISFLLSDVLRNVVKALEKLWTNVIWKGMKGFFEAMRKRTLGRAAEDLD